MESRPVILLKKGYFLGWLSFEYKNPLSRLREAFIVSEVEKELFSSTLCTRAIVASGFYSGVSKAYGQVYDPLIKATELTLPYTVKPDKISNDITPEDRSWKAFIDAKQKELDEQNLKKKNNK